MDVSVDCSIKGFVNACDHVIIIFILYRWLHV